MSRYNAASPNIQRHLYSRSLAYMYMLLAVWLPLKEPESPLISVIELTLSRAWSGHFYIIVSIF